MGEKAPGIEHRRASPEALPTEERAAGAHIETTEARPYVPELRLIKEAFATGVFTHERNNFLDDHPRVELDRLKRFIDSESASFDTQERLQREEMARTSLPESSEMGARIRGILASVQDDLAALRLLPKDYEKKAAGISPLRVEYDESGTYGSYVDHAHFQSPEDVGTPSAVIEVGGAYLRRKATQLREKLEDRGVSIGPDESIDLVTRHMVAHEYGHRISSAYEPAFADGARKTHPFYERMKKLQRDNPLMLSDTYHKEGVLEEHLAQSFAHHAVIKTLQEGGYSPEVADVIESIAGENPAALKEFKDLIAYMQEHGLDEANVEQAVWEAQQKLEEAGEASAAERLRLSFREAGYYLKPLDADQLRFVVEA